ncbi:XRE family transcriptional regulator [Leucobacter sp. OH2974_COT-288]|uniref:Transcriptional regulator with XRE-family HTH domain n=1 Tax=Canibacter oris TaxID=1365628 RepID=A0A840DGS1_9MICO|nr:helix-turn-helix transcriptional regulator [Canibacter oris]MBB4070893.1 transcriptional regulator with XRE-family HTH domain [Canibacter oris]RRD36582.1 XRE family transcriptional regulator [Leucobacter sp. OH2974_COT-288]
MPDFNQLDNNGSLSDSSRSLLLGKRLKHFRKEAGLTLEQLSSRVGLSISQLSNFENGKREPKITLLQQLAAELQVSVSEFFTLEPPSKRSALEIAFAQLQQGNSYQQLQLPKVRSLKKVSDEALEALVGLAREVQRQAQQQAATPEGARRANTDIRSEMRQRDFYLPEIEALAADLMRSVGHTGGALTHRTVDVLAQKLGFSLIFVDDLPPNTRSITDFENGRIYLPPASIPGGHGLRALALQALAHRVLGHEQPGNYKEFLQQRLEINYFASACLMPEKAAVQFLQSAKRSRNLAIEDLRDAFGVTHETAAHRFTNLATTHLGLRTHFYRTDAAGGMIRGYSNDGLPFPTDSGGNIEGQMVCKNWPGRVAFHRRNRTNEFYQYTDTPVGTFWSTVQTGDTADGGFSITCGVGFDDAKWFRGRETPVRRASGCPDLSCCKHPTEELLQRWEGKSWASAKMHQNILAPLPTGTFPGVDETEMYEFLTNHSDARNQVLD